MKILHCSDIHLGKRPIGKKNYSNTRYNDYFVAFENIVNYAVENSIDVFLISGDFFDRKEIFPEILAKAENILLKLKKKKIKVIMIEGNHDKIYANKRDESWLIYLQEKGIVTVLESKSVDDGFEFGKITIDDVNFYGVGYFGSFTNAVVDGLAEELDSSLPEEKGSSAPFRGLGIASENVELDLFGNPVVDEKLTANISTGSMSGNLSKNVVLIHTALGDGSEDSFFPGTVSSENLKKLQDKAIYVAGGHFHSHSVYPSNKTDKPFFFVPGSPEYWDLAEKGKRGFIVFDTDSLEHKFIESRKRKKIDIKLDISAKTASEFEEQFKAESDSIGIEKGCMVYLIITLTNSITIDVNECENYIEELGAIKALIRVEYAVEKIYTKGEKRQFNIADVEREVISSMGAFADYTDAVVDSLTRLKENHSEKQEDVFYDNYLSMIDSIIESSIKSSINDEVEVDDE